MTFRKMQAMHLANQRVLIRADLNVPLLNGQISDDTRIRACIPTFQHALKAGAGVIVMSHLGRPTEGEVKPEDSLKPIAERLAILLNQEVKVISNWQGYEVPMGSLVLLENVRCNPGEKKNSTELGKQYAALCDIFLNDAFATAHRAEASTHAVAQFAKEVGAGLLMEAELDALSKALKAPARPLVAIVAGSKVSTKLTILESLADKVDQLIVGGGIANTFLLAEGQKIGKSLAEPDLLDHARTVIKKLRARGGVLPLPTDVVVGKHCAAHEPAITKSLIEVTDEDHILDIGPHSAAHLAGIIQSAGTIVWNGPVGVFEFDQFGHGTEALARAIAASSAFSIAGGGDTLAAITKYGISNQIGYISTGGGAFLEFLEGKTLPAVEILEKRADL